MRSYIIASYTLSGELARIQKDNIMLSFCFLYRLLFILV